MKAALYSRMPVAASRIGSLEELLTDARLGWLLPADDIAAWAAWIRQLATAPPARVPDNIDVPTADTFFAHMLAIYHDQAPR